MNDIFTPSVDKIITHETMLFPWLNPMDIELDTIAMLAEYEPAVA